MAMGYNKIEYFGKVLIDLTADTVTPETLAEGVIAHDKSGALIVGTMKSDEDLTAVLAEQEALIAQLQEVLKDKAAGGGETEPDPHELYQRVEYITSDGASYCITDFIADNTCGMELVASFPVLEDKPPMGSRIDAGNTRFYCVYPLSANSFYFGFNTGSTISVKPSADKIYRLQTNFINCRLVNIFDADGIRLGGTAISQTLTQQTVPVTIFGYYHGTNNTVYSVRAFTFYGARCSKANDVVREYVPCYRKSDGVIGLYEEFTGTFLENQGTGTFTKGADIEW